jgi:hypothetical protein
MWRFGQRRWAEAGEVLYEQGVPAPSDPSHAKLYLLVEGSVQRGTLHRVDQSSGAAAGVVGKDGSNSAPGITDFIAIDTIRARDQGMEVLLGAWLLAAALTIRVRWNLLSIAFG